MKMVKNLSKANIRNYEGFERREDLDFVDDGNYFRGFSYKGMPITTLRSEKYNEVYLSIRVDYLQNEFTFSEWHATQESQLCNKYNGVSEFDIDELIETVEKIAAKVAEMNEATANEEIDMTEVKTVIAKEIAYAEKVVEDFKKNYKWYEASEYNLKRLVACLKNQEQQIKRLKNINVDELERKLKKGYIERLNKYGYVEIRKDGYYLTEMIAAIL